MIRFRWAALSFLLALPACRDEQVIVLDRWRVQLEDSPAERPVKLPVHLDELPSHPSRYFLRTEVTLPTQMQNGPITLAVPHLPGLVSLRVDGQEVPALDNRWWDRYRSSGPHRWRLPPAVAAGLPTRLELAVESHWTLAGWIDSVPRVSATRFGDRRFLWLTTYNQWMAAAAVSTGILLGMLYLSIFLFDRRRSSYAWFGMGALPGAFYSAFWLGPTQAVFGKYDGAIMAAALALAVIFAIYFLHAHFGLGRPSRLWGVAMGFFAVLAAVLNEPFLAVRYLAWPMIVFVLFAVGYQVVVLVRLSRRRPPPMNVWIVMLCWLVIGLTVAPDSVEWLGYGQSLSGIHAACFGIMMYVILQALALSREHTFSLAKSDELNRELAARIQMLETSYREIETLNLELRRQIAGRSHHLSQAIERMESGSSRRGEWLLPGELVHDRYRVLRRIGKGGMGTVYEVRRLRDGRPFALKILNSKTRGMSVARFAREAEIVAQIDHPNVVSIADIDVTAQGELFLVMELVRGTTLQQEQSRYGHIDWALPVLCQIAQGLDAIHARGIVHRDLKPANVLLEHPPGASAPHVKIADFGIASLRTGASTGGGSGAGEGDDEEAGASQADTVDLKAGSPLPMTHSIQEMTRTGVIMGTPMYMAPELGRGAKNASAASDMFSLGLIAYEVLSGNYPEFGPGRTGGVPGPAISLRAVCPHVDSSVILLVDRCVSVRPEERPPAHEFVAILRSAPGSANSGLQTGSSGRQR
ncbi:MAG TPA: protein kinase [Polyangia bacterium]|nr:protein kinase [Polyangia bacterium]